VWGAEFLEARHLLASDLVISEFLASNDNGLRDQDHDRPDWIEILNTGAAERNLEGWFLTDDTNDLDKWRFPDVSLGPNERLVVFASEKNRSAPDSELHTNFRLSADGDYLALVNPDGITVAFDFGSAYPPQLPDVSFGMPQQVSRGIALVPSSAGRWFVPTADNGGASLGTRWTDVDFDDSTWMGDTVGIGYERSTGYEELITTDVGTAMFDVNQTAYLRMPFTVDNPAGVYSLTLSMQYDDGYVAYINGRELVRRNAPTELSWNSGATDAHRDRDAVIPEDVAIDVGQFPGLLRQGKNVLAIHALNDDIVSSDFLIVPRVTASSFEQLRINDRHYFAAPTPAEPNGIGTTTLITSVTHQPNEPMEGQDLTVTAMAVGTEGPVSTMTLFYRAMFDSETSVEMFDDGLHRDNQARDGIFGGTIPGGIASAGQMIRYRVVAGDSAENSFRAPVFADVRNSSEYYGTVVHDSSIQSNLPVFHLFLEDPAASEVQPGTRGALFHDGKFYDNIEVDPTGRTVGLAGPKKSHDLFFASDRWFELGGTQFRMDDFDIISDYWNREKLRVPLGYETFRNIGTPAHLSMNARVQRNGEFFGTYFFVDGGNERFLERAGLDPQGALYKMNLGFSTGQGTFKKQTRTHEDISDLRALFNGLALSGEARVKYLVDNVNIPAMVNFMAGLVIMAHGDCCEKNLYIYRDTEGTGEWEAVPWDVDSAFGRGGVGLAPSYFTEAGGIFAGRDNRLLAALLDDVPGFREMYLRRLRTLMDEILQPPGTPPEELKFERRIDEMVQSLASDAQLDFDKWGSWKTDPVTQVISHGKTGVPTWMEEVDKLRNEYFPARRVFLFNALKQANGGKELEPQPDGPSIRFGQIDPNPTSGNQDEEFLELVNNDDFAVDISGWQLTGGIQHTFRPGTVIPSGGRLYVSPNVNAFRARTTGPSGGQGLIVQGNYEHHISNHGATIRLMGADQVIDQIVTAAQPSLAQQYLRISEIMYHPRDAATGDRFEADDYEFIELVNISPTATLDLKNVHLTQGVEFTFPAVLLGPGARTVVVRNRDAFVQRYGTTIPIAGQYGGTASDFKLSNGGEAVRLEIASGDPIQEFAYDDNWIPITDGAGHSLSIVDALGSLDRWNVAAGWRASELVGGSPGTGGPAAGDFNGDGQLNIADVDLFLAGLRAGDATFDLTEDDVVDDRDLAFLIEDLLKTSFGDANLDGTFDSSDLVQIFQSAEFEDPTPGNSSWAEGDWDGDGDFLTSDLVLAFQMGNYVANAVPAKTTPRIP
jgi:hypothetical protein